jgi:LPXTG-motif cell wall-anchored protein
VSPPGRDPRLLTRGAVHLDDARRTTAPITRPLSTLPKTGTWTGPAAGLGLVLLLGGLTLIHLDRHRPKTHLSGPGGAIDRSG